MIVYQLENQPQEFSKIESSLKFQVRRGMIVYQLKNQPQEFSKIESPLNFQVRRLRDSIPTGKSTPGVLKDRVTFKIPGKEGMIVYQLENQPQEFSKIESPLNFQVRRV